MLLTGLARTAVAQHDGQFTASFDRDVNRMRWTGGLLFAQNSGGWDISVDNRFNSEALTFGTFTSFRDENQSRWRVVRAVRDNLLGSVTGTTAWYSQGEVFSGDVLTGLRYQPVSALWVEPVFGAAWDRRPGPGTAIDITDIRADAGLAFGLRAEGEPRLDENFGVSFFTDAVWRQMQPRIGRGVRTGGTLQGDVEDGVLNVDLLYTSFRRDIYQAASFLNREVPRDAAFETIEATMTDTLLAGLRYDMPLAPEFRGETALRFLSSERRIRTFDAPLDAVFFDTDMNRRTIDAEATVVYGQNDRIVQLSASGRADVERRTLTNRAGLPPVQAQQKAALLRQSDFDRGHLSLRAVLRYPFLRRFVLSAHGTASILRHDTPATNFDDRDEAFHTAQAGLLWQMNRYFEADIRMFGSYYHTVYLRAQRSAENNVQQSIRLRPAIRWRPSPFTRLEVTSEVRATYTVDDFRMEGRRSSDQAARELRYDARFQHQPAPGVHLMAQGGFSDLRLGRLLWSEFAEIPFDTLKTYNGWVRLQVGTRTVTEIGVRAFVRTDFDRAVSVRYPRVDGDGTPVTGPEGQPRFDMISRPGREWIEQAGPTCSIDWPLSQTSRIRFDGWLQFQRIRQDVYGELPEGLEEVIRRAARRGTVRTIPNLSLSVIWGF